MNQVEVERVSQAFKGEESFSRPSVAGCLSDGVLKRRTRALDVTGHHKRIRTCSSQRKPPGFNPSGQSPPSGMNQETFWKCSEPCASAAITYSWWMLPLSSETSAWTPTTFPTGITIAVRLCLLAAGGKGRDVWRVTEIRGKCKREGGC